MCPPPTANLAAPQLRLPSTPRKRAFLAKLKRNVATVFWGRLDQADPRRGYLRLAQVRDTSRWSVYPSMGGRAAYKYAEERFLAGFWARRAQLSLAWGHAPERPFEAVVWDVPADGFLPVRINQEQLRALEALDIPVTFVVQERCIAGWIAVPQDAPETHRRQIRQELARLVRAPQLQPDWADLPGRPAGPGALVDPHTGGVLEEEEALRRLRECAATWARWTPRLVETTCPHNPRVSLSSPPPPGELSLMLLRRLQTTRHWDQAAYAQRQFQLPPNGELKPWMIVVVARHLARRGRVRLEDQLPLFSCLGRFMLMLHGGMRWRSVRDLSRDCGTNHMTAHRAQRLLREHGLAIVNVRHRYVKAPELNLADEWEIQPAAVVALAAEAVNGQPQVAQAHAGHGREWMVEPGQPVATLRADQPSGAGRLEVAEVFSTISEDSATSCVTEASRDLSWLTPIDELFERMQSRRGGENGRAGTPTPLLRHGVQGGRGEAPGSSFSSRTPTRQPSALAQLFTQGRDPAPLPQQGQLLAELDQDGPGAPFQRLADCA